MKNEVIQFQHDDQVLNIAVRIHRSSSTWIVGLHGLQSNSEMFVDLFEQPFLNDYSQLAIDFVGFGNSDKPESFSYDIQDQTEIVSAVIKALGIKQMHLIGHSMGGMVGSLLLHTLGDQILSFTNCEGNLVYEDCGKSKDVVKNDFVYFSSTHFPQIKSALRESTEPSAPYRTRWVDTIPDYAFYKASHSIVEYSSNKKILKAFTTASQKRLFVYGSQNARKKDALVQHTDIALAEIPNAGHFMLLDNPTASYTAIENFLK